MRPGVYGRSRRVLAAGYMKADETEESWPFPS